MMACEICGRGACDETFHSAVAQAKFRKYFDFYTYSSPLKVIRELIDLNDEIEKLQEEIILLKEREENDKKQKGFRR